MGTRLWECFSKTSVKPSTGFFTLLLSSPIHVRQQLIKLIRSEVKSFGKEQIVEKDYGNISENVSQTFHWILYVTLNKNVPVKISCKVVTVQHTGRKG